MSFFLGSIFEIYHLSSACEFPWEITRALELDLYRTDKEELIWTNLGDGTLARISLGRFLCGMIYGEDAILQAQEAIANSQDPQIMGDKHQGAVLFAGQALQKIHDLPAGHPIERCRRLIC